MPEMIDVLDEDGKKTGQVLSREDVHDQELLHGQVFVWLYNQEGEVLVQFRSKNKDVYPGVWDVSVGGHISSGSTPLKTALQECAEEVGVHLKQDDLEQVAVVFDKKVSNQGKAHHDINWVYIAELPNGVNVTIQESEVEGTKMVPISELIELKKNEKFAETYANRNDDIYIKAFKAITKKLSKQRTV